MDAPFGFFFLTCRGIARARAVQNVPPPPLTRNLESADNGTELDEGGGEFYACIKMAENSCRKKDRRRN